ncbi:MAG: hypothetical protein ACRD1J_04270 [Terriglobia bacterium]
MGHETVLTIFVIVAAVALVIQAVMIACLCFIAFKIRRQVKETGSGIKEKVDLLAAQALEIMAIARGPIQTAASNIVEVSRIIRERTGQVDQALEELTGRSRDQLVRIDELIGNLITKADAAAKTVERGIASPVRETFAVFKGVQTALDLMFSRRRPSTVSQATQDEEMFI